MAGPELPAEEAAIFQKQLPELYKKLKQGKHVHIAFAGDPVWMQDSTPNHFVPTFLRQLEEGFFYVGGVYNLLDKKQEHLNERRAKITYECRATEVADPSVFHLMQTVSTRRFVE